MKAAVRDFAASLFCFAAVACAGDVAGLERDPPQENRDAGPPDDAAARDAGFEGPDARAADAGVPDAIADAGGPLLGCEEGWIDVVSVEDPNVAVTGTSFAARPEGFALTWTERSTTTRTLIAFFDPTGLFRRGPIVVGERSRVIAYETGFLRGGMDGIERYDAFGATLETRDRQFVPMALVRGRLWGLNLDSVISTVEPGTTFADINPFAVGVSAPGYRAIGFGPDRFVVAEDPPNFDQPASVRVFGLEIRGAVEIASFTLPAEMINGEPHLGHALGAAAWNDGAGHFELLVGMRLGPTRQFGARLMHLIERGLVDGPPLYPAPANVAYESLLGAIAVGSNGSLALAYRSPYSASPLNLDLVRRFQVEHFPIESGASYPTNALLAPFGDRFAVVYGKGAEGTAVFERTLQLRCDIAQ